MQTRERILAGLLAAVVVVWLGTKYKSSFTGPLQSRNNEIVRLEGNVDTLELRQAQLLEAARLQAEWRDASLPPETLAAEREYRNWLYAMAQVAGWDDLEVSTGQRGGRRYDSFSTVSTTLDGAATLDGVNHFLTLMETAGLVHRVTELNITCEDNDGNPEMTVRITMEGVAMPDARERSRLFPTALLVEECVRRDELVRVDSAAGFPETVPFRVRIDNELLDVVGIEENAWQVQRGVGGTFPEDHDETDVVELLPLRESDPDAADLALIVDRIFVLPRQRGRMRLADLPPAIRGRDFTERLEVENWDPLHGTPRFELVSGAPDDLEFNPSSGRLDWKLPEDAELTAYDLEVAVYGDDADKPVLEETLDLQVRRPNRPPRLVQPDTIEVWLGREVTFRPEVDDPDLPEDELSFSLSEVPPGARFDRRTGEFHWTPPVTDDVGELELDLTVTDTGVPPESDEVRLVLDLRDDSARYTYLVGTIIQGDDREAWLNDRSEPNASRRMTRLTEGESFQVADVGGTVEAIRLGAIDVRSDGALYELSKGDNLRELRLIEEAAAGETSSAAGAFDAVDSD